MSERRQAPGVSPTERHAHHEQLASVTPRGAARFLVIVVLSLTALSLIGQAAKHFLPDFVLRDRFAETFDVDQEGNIPTLYSALAILGCAYLLWVIARVEREIGGRFTWHWRLMAVIFVGLAADEYLAIHEEINPRLNLSDFTQFSAAAIMVVFVLGFAVVFFPLLLQLPPPVRGLFSLAGATFLSGAVVMETVGGHYVTVWGHDSMKYVLCTTVEELLEMMGIVLFIYTLLRYLTQGGRDVLLALRLRAHPERAGT